MEEGTNRRNYEEFMEETVKIMENEFMEKMGTNKEEAGKKGIGRNLYERNWELNKKKLERN